MMILKINGSGVRKYEIELTDCEIKDLAVALRNWSNCEGTLDYGCIQISVTDPGQEQRKGSERW